ncbi:MAG: head-tail connector protein [Shinella sp.]|nr:head-tail connector protein [Shinella sp.]
MASLVDLAFVKQALRVDHSDDDDVLASYLDAATGGVLRYLKGAADPEWTVDTVPASVRIAIIMAVQSLYEPDQAEMLSGLGTGDPRNPIVAMLYSMRDPTLA